jgi:hypothetical protein
MRIGDFVRRRDPQQLAVIERARRTPTRILEIERTRRGAAYRNMLKRYSAKAALERELERLVEAWSAVIVQLQPLKTSGLDWRRTLTALGPSW